jgi:hypothetical protein
MGPDRHRKRAEVSSECVHGLGTAMEVVKSLVDNASIGPGFDFDKWQFSVAFLLKMSTYQHIAY